MTRWWPEARAWLAGRWAWLVAGAAALVAVLVYGRGQRRAGELGAEVRGLEAARTEDARRARVDAQLLEATVEDEQAVRAAGAERAAGPHTQADLDALHARVEARRRRGAR